VTANVPDDVAAASGTLVFAAGEGTKQVTVDVQGDLAVEPDEAFRLVLADPIASDGRAVLAGEGTLATIVNDDASEPTDTVPPITNAVAAPPPNDAGWNREDVTVTLTATDEGTGVEQIAYRLTGAQTGEDTVIGAQATVQVTADGITTVHYRATDKAGNVETERTLVVRIDRTAPAVSCTVSPSELWPPNHELIPVTVTVEVADGAAGSDGFTLAAVASNEPDDGTGDGATSPDIQGFDVGTSDTAGLLRAERNGNGSGRVYTLTYVGRDRASNQRTCTVTVTVPHDRR
jgi:hypothetical protein